MMAVRATPLGCPLEGQNMPCPTCGGVCFLVVGAATLGTVSVLAWTGSPAPAAAQPAEPAAPAQDPSYVLNHKLKTIDGEEKNLADYQGKVVLIVNVASRCGFTTQYEGLQRLYEEKKDDGLVILGFPANNFGGQEPGTGEEIKQFCTREFGVTFPLFEKISVKGEDQHPLYKQLAAQPAPIGGDPKWNFTKFLVDRRGKVVARFDAEKSLARTPDLEPALLKKIDELLKQPSP